MTDTAWENRHTLEKINPKSRICANCKHFAKYYEKRDGEGWVMWPSGDCDYNGIYRSEPFCGTCKNFQAKGETGTGQQAHTGEHEKCEKSIRRENTDGTILELETSKEKEERLLKRKARLTRVTNELYDVCKREGLTIKELKTIVHHLLDRAKETRIW